MNKLFISLISLILVVVFGAIVLFPKYQERQALIAEVLTKQTELSFREEYLSQLESLSERLKNYSGEVAKISSALPADPNVPSLFHFLQSISSQAGVILDTVSSFKTSSVQEGIEGGGRADFESASGTSDEEPTFGIPTDLKTSPPPRKNFQATQTGVKIVGPFEAFMVFLEMVEKSARLIEINSITFSLPGAEEGELFTFDVSLTINSYGE